MKNLNELGIIIKESKNINIREILMIKPSEYLNNAIYMDVASNLLLFLAKDEFHEKIILDIDNDYFEELLEYLTILDPTDRFVKYMELKENKVSNYKK